MSLSKRFTDVLVSRKPRKPPVMPKGKNWDNDIKGTWQTDRDVATMVDCYQYKVEFIGNFSCQPDFFEEAFNLSKHSILSSICKEELEIVDRLRAALYDHDIDLAISLCYDLRKEFVE